MIAWFLIFPDNGDRSRDCEIRLPLYSWRNLSIASGSMDKRPRTKFVKSPSIGSSGKEKTPGGGNSSSVIGATGASTFSSQSVLILLELVAVYSLVS